MASHDKPCSCAEEPPPGPHPSVGTRDEEGRGKEDEGLLCVHQCNLVEGRDHILWLNVCVLLHLNLPSCPSPYSLSYSSPFPFYHFFLTTIDDVAEFPPFLSFLTPRTSHSSEISSGLKNPKGK